MKQYRIRFDDRVRHDVLEAVFYYNSKAPGLGKRFYQQVKNGYAYIRQSPFFQVRYNGIRCLPLDKFPYMIHYSVDETEGVITIKAIINCYQNPDTKWLVNEP